MPVSASEPKIDISGLNDRRVAVWWHSAIKKNTRDRTQPNVIVSFRVVNADGTFGPLEKRQFPITQLGFLRIGSIWHRGRRIDEINMDTVYAEGDVSAGRLKFSIQGRTVGGRREYLIPPHIYDLEDDFYHNQSWLLLLSMKKKNGESFQLIVPCIEVFTRLYGRNAEVRRVLVTYPWDEAKKRLFVPDAGFVDEMGWHVELPDRMVNEDTFLIAHMQHDRYAMIQAKSIWAQIEAAQKMRGREYAFLKVAPWFRGKAQLKVKGFWLDQKRFIGLQINGASTEPANITIYRRRSYGVVEDEAPEMGGVRTFPTKVIRSVPESVEVTGEFPPDHDSGHVDVSEDHFEILGNRGTVIRDNYAVPYQARGKPLKDDDSGVFSAGEAYGAGKGVGKAEMKSDLVIESHGMLRDFWDALLLLSESQPKLVRQVRFLSGNEFVEGREPTLVAFHLFFQEEDEELEEPPHWIFLSARNRDLRGALVARALTREGFVYFIEIQRKKHVKKQEEGKAEVCEEAYRGIVFRLEDDEAFPGQLALLMRALGKRKGKLRKPPPGFKGDFETYIHRPRSTIKCDTDKKVLMKAELCKSIVLRALMKILEEAG